jgi:hypothetical protein
MEIVQLRGLDAAPRVGEEHGNWAGLDAHPARTVAAIAAEAGPGEEDRAGRAERHRVFVPSLVQSQDHPGAFDAHAPPTCIASQQHGAVHIAGLNSGRVQHGFQTRYDRR